MFEQLTRLGADDAGITQDVLQNKHFADHHMQSFYAQECTMRRPIEFATSQVNVNYSAAGGRGNQCGIGGCNIDENNALMFGTQTHPKCRISLFQRPFVTIPYLGRGPGNCAMESQLQQSNGYVNRKTVNTSSEVSYIPLSNYPLIPSLKETITNPQYLVEEWQRGGVSTRKAPVKHT